MYNQIMRSRIIGSIIFLIIWTILVLTNNIAWFDDLVYNFIYSLKSDSLTSVMKVITSFSNVKIMIVLTLLSLLGLIWKRKESIYLVATLGLSTTINLILKNIIRRDRPLHFRFIEETGFSYPSGHAMGSIAFYGSIIVIIKNSNIDKKYKYIINSILGLLIISIGISRIYLGVHYPSDIVGGFTIGFILLNILDYVIRRENEKLNNRSK